MKKYKLIHKVTGEEHLCDKISLNGFDYYFNDEEIKNNDWIFKKKINENDTLDNDEILLVKEVTADVEGRKAISFIDCPGYYYYDECKKIIATTNNRIGMPIIIDITENIGLKYVLSLPNSDYLSYGVQSMIEKSYLKGYNKHAETHHYSDEDMDSFADWLFLWQQNSIGEWKHQNRNEIIKTTKKLRQIWKDQQVKILYYD